VIQRS